MKFWTVALLGIILTGGWVSAQYIESQRKDIIMHADSPMRVCGEMGGGLKIATFATNPPFGWSEGKSNFSSNGFGVSLMDQIAQELNIVYGNIGFDKDEDAMAALDIGAVDMIVGAYYDPKIKGIGHRYLIPAFIPNVITVVFLKGKKKEVKDFEDLIGLKGAVRQDEQFYPYIRLSLPEELEIESVFDSREAFTKLLTGEVDFLLSSPYAAEAEARRFKLNKQIELISTPLMAQELFVLYSKNSECPQYQDEIAQKLQEKRQDLNGLKRDLISFIDTWGQKFKNEPSLIDQLKAEKILPEDYKIPGDDQ